MYWETKANMVKPERAELLNRGKEEGKNKLSTQLSITVHNRKH